jgi:glycosyltransferase involved in cell wall biosynthesis
MKILFVSSGNSSLGISPIVKRQGESIIGLGVDVEFFNIKGKGIRGYLGNLSRLNRTIKQTKPDLIHAHYSKSGILSALTGFKPLVVSFMGSDTVGCLARNINSMLSRLIWQYTIVKSHQMKLGLVKRKIIVLPNGVDTMVFKPVSKASCQEELNWSISIKHILFAANPNRPEKNFSLIDKAIKILKSNQVELHTLMDVKPDVVPIMMNAADVVVLTSYREGSPNVIKEAMACDRPIIATPVGDIPYLFENVEGTFISDFNVNTMKENISKALKFEKSKGRNQIFKLGLSSSTVAEKLTKIYQSLLKK